ncbi:glycosyltransferase [Rubinisphaera margarita]|uniref:glycosyltransferase n=1 Tax=Rubinisphaera margarita TaxID=2909586 RepID=UPI001EE82FFD|nr:glycosyltransferase [Rubinisphaera margarita]MCG6154751.1 glycosyltransferase [Rubinisphaera margarita]
MTIASNAKNSKARIGTSSAVDPVAPVVSIIVPTFREAENLPVLIPQVAGALENSGITFEILIVDDNSPDGTPAVCDKLAESWPVRLLVRTTERGLSSAVIHGMRHATGDVLLVMDADLSHPPEKVPELVAAILEQQGDFVIGSRYVVGGTTGDDWSLFRWINSQVATWLSRGLTSARDPMAGFFALRRTSFESAEALNPIGYKIGLELMVKCGCRHVSEVPIHFRDRLHGESKLSLKEQLNYIRHLGRLYKFQLGKWFTPLAFAVVGASGVIVDLALLTLLMLWVQFPLARAGAIAGAMTWNFAGNRWLTFSDRRGESAWKQYLKFCLSCSLGALISWGVSTAVWNYAASVVHSPMVAAVAGILSGFALNYLLSNHFAFRQNETVVDSPAVESAELTAQEAPAAFGSKVATTIGALSVLVMACVLSGWSLNRQQIDGPDQAHNVMTSIFFHDMAQDLPSNPVGYAFEYQRQYPALGLTFWPPLFHATAGTIMLITGPDLFAVRLTMVLFTALFAIAMFASVRRGNSLLSAVLAVGLALSTAVMFDLTNTTMLEVPSMAMAFLALWLYRNVTTRGSWTHWTQAVLAGALCAAIAYTKQPAVFVLAAMGIDLLVSHRSLLKEARTWIAAATTVVLMLPLAAFTLKYGRVNIAQSIGIQGNIYVDHHRVADRWSLEGWTYYLELIPTQFALPVLFCAAAGTLLILSSRDRLKQNGLWLWCIVCWYLMFSYFDNKQIRFVAYATPFLAILATTFASWLSTNIRLAGLAAMIVLAGLGINSARLNAMNAPRGYDEMKPLLMSCSEENEPGNLGCFGEDHHLFTAQLRLLDSRRQRFNVRGDDALRESDQSLVAAARDYQIRWLIIQPESEPGQSALAQIHTHPGLFTPLSDEIVMDNGEKSFAVQMFRFNGELATEMKSIALKSQMLGIAAD